MSDADRTVEQQIEKLRCELDKEREKRLKSEREYEKTLALIKKSLFDLEDAVYGEYDSATAELETEKRGGVFDRLDALEQDELSVTELLEASNDATLPIQQLTAGRKAGHVTDQEYKNKYRASIVWSEFPEQAIQEYGKLKLTTKRVGRILAQHDLPHDRTTANRVAEFVASLSNPNPENRDPKDPDNLIKLVHAKNANILVANPDELSALAGKQDGEVSEEADREFEQLAQAQVSDD